MVIQDLLDLQHHWLQYQVMVEFLLQPIFDLLDLQKWLPNNLAASSFLETCTCMHHCKLQKKTDNPQDHRKILQRLRGLVNFFEKTFKFLITRYPFSQNWWWLLIICFFTRIGVPQKHWFPIDKSWFWMSSGSPMSRNHHISSWCQVFHHPWAIPSGSNLAKQMVYCHIITKICQNPCVQTSEPQILTPIFLGPLRETTLPFSGMQPILPHPTISHCIPINGDPGLINPWLINWGYPPKALVS